MLQAFFSMSVLIPPRNRTSEPTHEACKNARGTFERRAMLAPQASHAGTHDLIGLIWESTALRMATTGSR